MATAGESFSMCFKSWNLKLTSMIVNTALVSLATTHVRRQEALTFWDTENQVTQESWGQRGGNNSEG